MASRKTNTGGKKAALRFQVAFERETDGRWIAEIASLPGAMAYGKTKGEALAAVEALALRILADRIEEEKLAQTAISFASGG